MAYNGKKNHSIAQQKTVSSTPIQPESGYSKIYPKSDGLWYYLDDAGIETSLGGSGVQSVTGLGTDNTDPLNPIVELAIDNTTLAGQGTLLDPLRAIQTETAQVVLFADLATTEALKPCTYNIGTLGVGAILTGDANGQLSTISFTGKIDNTTTVLGQIILVKNQTSQLQNGLYEVTQLGSVSTPFILTRTTDADTQAELYPIQVNVFNGATNANSAFLQKTVDPVIGTSPIVFQTTPIGITNTPVLHLDTVTSTVLPTCTYTAGTNATLPGVGAFLQASGVGALGTINGIALVAGMRILVKDQANQAHNGAYTVAIAGNGTTAWKLVRADAWGSSFVRLQREWKINNSLSTKFGARYSTDLNSLANTAVGTTALVFNEVPTSGLPAWVETNATDLTVWCNGKGNISSNTSYGDEALKSNTTGSSNTAIGNIALRNVTTGIQNTAIGHNSLVVITNSSGNTAIGASCLSIAGGFASSNNTAIGSQCLSSLTGGSSNISIGAFALQLGSSFSSCVAIGTEALKYNTVSNNVGIGDQSLTFNTTGNNNTALGYRTLNANVTGSNNTAVGKESLLNNTTGSSNTAFGTSALSSTTSGGNNSAFGTAALANSTGALGFENSAFGSNALQNATSGFLNSAFGSSALGQLTTGVGNVAVGSSALLLTTMGDRNTTIGNNAMSQNTTGNSNTAVGESALVGNTTGISNTAVGRSTASNNFSGSVILGREATATGNNQFVVGSSGYNAGSVTNAAATQSHYWTVKINGTDYKILLST
jgi:hypothetical protein